MGEPSSSLKDDLPPTGLSATLSYPNGVTKEAMEEIMEVNVENFRDRSEGRIKIQQCGKCGFLKGVRLKKEHLKHPVIKTVWNEVKWYRDDNPYM